MSLEIVHQMRHLTILLSIALLGNATAQTLGSYSYELNDGVSVTITDYPTNQIGELEIVDTLGGFPVASIGIAHSLTAAA